MSTHQIELLSSPPEPPSVLSAAVDSPETSPSEPLRQAEPELLPFQVGDLVVHVNPTIEWDGLVVATSQTHPWDCCLGMVLVAIEELKRVERFPVSVLQTLV